MKTISIAVVLALLVGVVMYTVVNNRDISIETPFASVTSTAPKVVTQVEERAEPSGEASPEAKPEALPATFMLGKLTCFRPQEQKGEDRVYLKLGNSRPSQTWELKAGKSIRVNLIAEAGTSVSLWEMDGFKKDGDDDLLGTATLQGRGGTLRFEIPETGDHLYTLSYKPESYPSVSSLNQ